MTLNNTISKLRNITTRTLPLPTLTSTLRANGDIPSNQQVMVQIRKVRSAEVIADTGATPLMLSVLKERRPGETRDEFQARLAERLESDPQAIAEMQQQIAVTMEAVVIRGVTAIAVVEEGTRPEWDAITLERGGERSLDLLGDDLNLVHDEIVAFSGLPYQRLGGAATTTFPEEQAGADSEPSSGLLRRDAEPVPEPAAG